MILDTNKSKLIFYTIPVCLFCLIPFFLITGPFLTDLAVSVISIIFLIYCIKNNNFSFFKKKYFLFFLIFWLYLCLNSIFNNLNHDSLRISFFSIRYGLFVVAIIALLDLDDRFLKYFFYTIFLCFTVLIVDGFFQYFSGGKNLIGLKALSANRVSGFFGEELILGSYLSRLWPIFFRLSIILFNKKSKFYFALILLFVLSETLIFLSGERSSFFYITLSTIFVIIFSNKLFKLRLFIFSLSILSIVVISFINPSAKERMVDKTIKQVFNLDNPKHQNIKKLRIFTGTHTEHYISAYKMFVDNKFFGVGVKNFRNFCKEKKYYSDSSCSTHPHNTYVQILSETGILGFIFLLFVLLYFCKYIFLHLNYKLKGKQFFSDFEICILSGILIYLWPIIPTGNVFNNWLTIIMILNFPLLIWSRKKSK